MSFVVRNEGQYLGFGPYCDRPYAKAYHFETIEEALEEIDEASTVTAGREICEVTYGIRWVAPGEVGQYIGILCLTKKRSEARRFRTAQQARAYAGDDFPMAGRGNPRGWQVVRFVRVVRRPAVKAESFIGIWS